MFRYFYWGEKDKNIELVKMYKYNNIKMHIYAVWGELRFPELTFAQLQFYSQLLSLSLRAVTGALGHRFVPFYFNLFTCTRYTQTLTFSPGRNC